MKLLVAAVLAVSALSSGSVVQNPNDGTFELLILHNNDMHARFEQTSQLSGTCTTADREAGKCYGGFPRVAHVVKEARRAAKSGEGPPVLYLNAGDTYTGTAWFTLYKSKIAVEFVNALQPDAVSLGNNEVDKNGLISSFLKEINTNIVSSNVMIKSAEKKQNVHKSLAFDVQGVKVGVVSFLTPNALDTAGNVEYVDEVLALKEEVAKLKAEDIKIIIALGHASLAKDIEIATEVDGIDIVIAGNKNQFFWNGNVVAEDMKPIIVTQKSGKKVPVIKSTAYNKFLGSLTIKFDADGELIDFHDSPIFLDSTIPQDEEAMKVVKSFYNEIVRSSEETIGNTAVVLDGDSCSFEECNLGNLIADSISYYHAVRYDGDELWTDAPITIIHGGAIAASIAPSNRPAAVMTNDLLTALPVSSNIVAVSTNGTILSSILEQAVSEYSKNNPNGQFLQFSGVRVTYDLSKDVGSRVVNALVRCGTCNVPEFFSIEESASYTILVPAALANGEYGYSFLADLPKQELEYDEVTVLTEYIKLKSPVYPEVAGRIVLENIPEEDSSAPGAAATFGSAVFSVVLVRPIFDLF